MSRAILNTPVTGATSVLLLLLLVSPHCVEGFVLPRSSTNQLLPTTTSLFAQDGILLMQKGLKWVLVPNSKEPYVGDVPSLSSSGATTAVETELNNPLPIRSAAEAVSTTSSVPVSPQIPASLEQAATAPLKPVVVKSSQVLEILPSTVDGSSSSAENAVDIQQVVEAFRGNHWARMPDIQETVSSEAGRQAPLLGDFLKGQAEALGAEAISDPNSAKFTEILKSMQDSSPQVLVAATLGSVQENGAKYSQLIQESGAKCSQLVQESGAEYSHLVQESGAKYSQLIQESGAKYSQMAKESAGAVSDYVREAVPPIKQSVKIDPTVFQALKEKIESTSTQTLSMEELKEFLMLDQLKAVGTEKLQSIANVDLFSFTALSSWSDFMASLEAVKSMLQQDGMTWDDVVNAMNLKENGTWYFAASFLILVFTISIGNSEDKDQRIILTEAAMPTSSDNESPSNSESPRLLLVDEEVNKLKDATSAMYAQLNKMNEDKNARAYEVATLQSELRNVMNKLDTQSTQEKELRLELEATKNQLERDTESLRQQLQERVAAEEELRQELASTQAKLEEEMEKVKMAKMESEKEMLAAKAEVTKLEGEKLELVDEIASLRDEMESLRQRLRESEEQNSTPEHRDVVLNDSGRSPTPGLNGDDGEDSYVETMPAKRAAIRGTATEARPGPSLPTISFEGLSNIYFADIADSVNSASSSQPTKSVAVKSARTKAAPTRKRVVKKVVVKKVVAKKIEKPDVNGDWSSMAPSTLKRKTVKELSEYLESKVSVSEIGFSTDALA